MKIAKWGNSLAIRIPADVVKALDLKEGDEIRLRRESKEDFQIVRKQDWEEAMESIKRLSRPFPKDFKFDREEANSR